MATVWDNLHSMGFPAYQWNYCIYNLSTTLQTQLIGSFNQPPEKYESDWIIPILGFQTTHQPTGCNWDSHGYGDLPSGKQCWKRLITLHFFKAQVWFLYYMVNKCWIFLWVTLYILYMFISITSISMFLCYHDISWYGIQPPVSWPWFAMAQCQSAIPWIPKPPKIASPSHIKVKKKHNPLETSPMDLGNY